jgi:OOP family OmpA-OmpF porin
MKKLVPVVVVCCCLFAPVAFARGFHFGVSAGQASFDVSQANARFSVDDTGYKGYFGYKFFRSLAVEASYVDFGSVNETLDDVGLEAEANSANLYALGILPVTPRIELFAKLGVAVWDSKTTITEDGSPEPMDESGTDFSYGLGLNWNFTERFGLRGELEYYGFGSQDVRLGSLGLFIQF